jgi:hypothetical protein
VPNLEVLLDGVASRGSLLAQQSRRASLRFRREIALFAATGVLISMVSLESVAKAAVTKCADVLVLGARGSDEHGPGTKPVGKSKVVWPKTETKMQLAVDPYGLGSEVNAIWNQLNFHILVEQHRTVEVRSVNFPAASAMNVSGIMKPPHPFFQGLNQGVYDSRNILKEAAKATNCPNQWIILAGYSQGAMVMHRLLQGMSQDPGDRSFARVVGTILIADGDQNAYDNTTRMGSALKSATGVAVNFDTFSGASPTKFDSSLKSHIFSVCTQLDIVCDNWPGLVLTYAYGYRVHLSYTKNLLYLAAADQIASDLSSLPKDASQCAAPLRAATDCVKTPTVGPTDQPTPTPSATTPTPSPTADPFAAGVTCPVNGKCEIGNIGPGGGIVFYVAPKPQSWGQYLEFAPATWNGTSTDPKAPWCEVIDVSLVSKVTDPELKRLIGDGIGTGRGNTKLMSAYCKLGAANLATAYRGGGKSDWFLPSRDELVQLYVNTASIGGLPTGGYWSSSEVRTDIAWGQYFSFDALYYKVNALYVRPVRAFS